MPFGQMMLFPTELTLKNTPDGIRMFSNPVREIELLKKNEEKWEGLTLGEANEKLGKYDTGELLRIKAKIVLDEFWAGLALGGDTIVNYDANFNQINKIPYFTDNPESMELSMELLIDRTSIEVFIDGGKYSYSLERKPVRNAKGLYFTGTEGLKVQNLEIQTLNSIW
jgi:sucrose-6-phosphate hydrolase SacC (GH32 family)